MLARRITGLFAVLTLALAGCVGNAANPAASPNAPVDTSAFKEKIKLACVGDSITAGSGTSGGNAYPAQLQRMLGDKWDVQNFGAGGRTLMNKADNPYQTKGKLKEALAFEPDVVVIMLGTNDSKPQNWKFKDTFAADYKDLVSKFTALKTHPRIFVVLPCPVPGNGNFGINQANMNEVMPLIDSVAKDCNLGEIDVFAAMKGKDELLPDRVHPNNQGAELLAKTVFKTLVGKDYAGASTVK
jgi:lysophospholipase L1-like esterase